uniref:Protein phosphatase 1 regulatory subunit and related proteins n=1 Tax=Cyriopagopus schmidti TaxID=29017 RepID=B5M6G4_CYRSC|nr:protein phosphatase 1 regulatory subunit and related proteins [Cyriopagopus schmidti]
MYKPLFHFSSLTFPFSTHQTLHIIKVRLKWLTSCRDLWAW